MLQAEQRETERSERVAITRANMLEHLADMIAEMKTLAGDVDARLLSSILDLAHKEAVDQAARAHCFKPVTS